ncbi:MAG TPA: hypothetical protein VM307_12960 [Egibacteraceae bacterium]|nr:hypothetical protein [Egibacteraceae bacterium]
MPPFVGGEGTVMMNSWTLRSRGARILTAAVVAALALAHAPSVPTASAATTPSACPDLSILDKAEVEALAPGTPLIGLTVEGGDTPTAIDFVVEHVQRGALQDGAPLVVARAVSGSPVTEGKGIWFGMSGSPVYTVNGTGGPDALVGAVAFGLAWDGESTIAGLQPAYQMEKVRSYPATSALATSATISSAGAQQVSASSGVPADQARRFEALTVPLSLSGVTSNRLPLVRRTAARAGLQVPSLAAPGTATTTATAPATVAPGDTFAAALSYGYVTAAGTGTTTYTCGDYAMAFGHPFFFAGRTHMGANHGTDAYVVRDRMFGSYKMATVGGLVGRLDQDRGAGIRAHLGGAISTVPVVSRFHSPDTGKRGRAVSDVVGQANVPFLGFIHTLTHLDDIADHWSDGSADLRWAIEGVTGNGKPWRMERGNRYTSQYDITFESSFDLIDDLVTLQNNPFRKVRFTGIWIHGGVEEDVHEYRVRRVRVWRNDAWRTPKRLRVTPGEVLALQVVLDIGGVRKVIERELTVPRRARGFGDLVVSGRGEEFEMEAAEEFIVDCGFEPCDEGPTGPQSFDELLKSMAKAPRNDVLTARLSLMDFDEETGQETFVNRAVRQRLDRVVSGAVSIPVRVRR